MSGWGASAQVSISAGESRDLRVNSVKFYATRKINYGFQGWEYAPPFSSTAKSLLCGAKGAGEDKFRKEYGDYFVAGENTGAFLQIVIESQGSTSSKGSDISTSLKASFSEFGVGGGASVSFSHQLS